MIALTLNWRKSHLPLQKLEIFLVDLKTFFVFLGLKPIKRKWFTVKYFLKSDSIKLKKSFLFEIKESYKNVYSPLDN
jgi:hypothetical protein